MKKTDEEQKSVSLNLTDTELVALIAERGAREATSTAQERLNFFLGIIAVVIALLSGAASLWINATISNKVAEAEQRIRAEVQQEVARETLAAQRELTQRINEQVEFAIMLTLVTSEADTFEDDYNEEKVQRVFNGLRTHLLPQMPSFDGDQRYFAQRRLEDIIDAFRQTGDYTRVFEIHDVFQDQLDLTPGIYFSLADSVMSTSIVRPDDLNKISPLIERLLAEKLHPSSNEFEDQRALMLLLDPGPDSWLVDDLKARILLEDQRYDGFSGRLGRMVDLLENETKPGGLNHSPGAVARRELLLEALDGVRE